MRNNPGLLKQQEHRMRIAQIVQRQMALRRGVKP